MVSMRNDKYSSPEHQRLADGVAGRAGVFRYPTSSLISSFVRKQSRAHPKQPGSLANVQRLKKRQQPIDEVRAFDVRFSVTNYMPSWES